MKIYSSCIVLCVFIEVCLCKIPDYVEICKKDNSLSDCLIKNYNSVVQHLATNGEPMYKLQQLNHVHIDYMPMSAGNLVITLKKPIFKGVEAFKIDAFDMSDKEIHMMFHVERIEYTGNYDMNGRILILPIQGQGDFNITHVDIKFDYVAKLKIEERNNKTYYYVAGNWNDTKIDLYVGKTYFYFSNLFGGDPKLGPEMNLFLNENNADVFDEVKHAIEEGLVFYLMHPYINGFLRHIPIDNLFKSN